jgi:hypothetical protein
MVQLLIAARERLGTPRAAAMNFVSVFVVMRHVGLEKPSMNISRPGRATMIVSCTNVDQSLFVGVTQPCHFDGIAGFSRLHRSFLWRTNGQQAN